MQSTYYDINLRTLDRQKPEIYHGFLLHYKDKLKYILIKTITTESVLQAKNVNCENCNKYNCKYSENKKKSNRVIQRKGIMHFERIFKI